MKAICMQLIKKGENRKISLFDKLFQESNVDINL